MDTLLELTGMQCHDLSGNGSIWLISTAHQFADGDYIPVYAEKKGGQITFFDDYEVFNHLDGRGYPVHDARRMKPLWNVLEKDGLTVDDGCIKLTGDMKDAQELFSRFLGAMVHVVDWEKERENIPAQIVSLSDEVYHYLTAWKPESTVKVKTDVSGISGTRYSFNYTFDGMPVMSIKPGANAIASAIKKLLDMKTNPDTKVDLFAVVNDGKETANIQRDVQIIQTVAKTIRLSRLMSNAKASTTIQ